MKSLLLLASVVFTFAITFELTDAASGTLYIPDDYGNGTFDWNDKTKHGTKMYQVYSDQCKTGPIQISMESGATPNLEGWVNVFYWAKSYGTTDPTNYPKPTYIMAAIKWNWSTDAARKNNAKAIMNCGRKWLKLWDTTSKVVVYADSANANVGSVYQCAGNSNTSPPWSATSTSASNKRASMVTNVPWAVGDSVAVAVCLADLGCGRTVTETAEDNTYSCPQVQKKNSSGSWVNAGLTNTLPDSDVPWDTLSAAAKDEGMTGSYITSNVCATQTGSSCLTKSPRWYNNGVLTCYTC